MRSLARVLPLLILLYGFSEGTAAAGAGTSQDAIDLSQCDFWIGETFNGAIRPIGRCHQSAWTSPVTLPLDIHSYDGIPENWQKGKNPPPLAWTVTDPKGQSKDGVITRVEPGAQPDRVRLFTASTLADQSLAIQGTLTLQQPTVVDLKSIPTLLSLLNREMNQIERDSLAQLANREPQKGAFVVLDKRQPTEWTGAMFTSPETGHRLYEVDGNRSLGSVNQYGDSGVDVRSHFRAWYERSSEGYKKISVEDSDYHLAGDRTITRRPSALLNIKGHQFFLVYETSSDGVKMNLQELDASGQWQLILEGPYEGR